MEVKAAAKYLRHSPRKARLVVDLVRGQKIGQALSQLRFVNKAVGLPLSKLIKSAVANALHNFDLAEDNLYIKEIRVDEGPTLKRWMPRAHGRATPLRKRTSHISLILAEIKATVSRKAKKQKLEAPVKIGAKPKDQGVKTGQKTDAQKPDKKAPIEPVKEIIDQRAEGKGQHTKIEGQGVKSFGRKIFRRKSG